MTDRHVIVKAPTAAQGRTLGAFKLGLKPSEVEIEILATPSTGLVDYEILVRPLTEEENLERALEEFEGRSAMPTDGEAGGMDYEKELLEETLAQVDDLLAEVTDFNPELMKSIKDLTIALDPNLAQKLDTLRWAATAERNRKTDRDGSAEIQVNRTKREAYVTLRPPSEGGRALDPDEIVRRIAEMGCIVPHQAEIEAIAERLSRPRAGAVVLTVTFRPGRFELAFTPDDMALLLTVHPPSEWGEPVTAKQVEEAIEAERIRFTPDREAIAGAVSRVRESGESVHDVVVAVGREPEHGKDAVLEWKVPVVPGEKDGFRLSDVPQPHLIQKGQLLLRVTPPTPGKDGMTLRGKAITPRRGIEPIVQSGPGTRKEERGTKLVAASDGRLEVDANRVVVLPYRLPDVQVLIRPDLLEAELVLTPGEGDSPDPVISPDEVLVICASRGLAERLDADVVRRLVEEVNTEKRFVRAVIARGEAPVPGRDGWIEYPCGDPLVPDSWSIHTESRVDHRERSSILSVRKDDVLAVLHDPVPGSAGVNVRGETLPPPPVSAAVREAGPGVVREGNVFRAALNGHFTTAGPLLRVDELFHVKDDLSMKIGNITHNGTVAIEGSVADNYVVKADGDVLIRRNLGASEILAGANITIGNGFIGRFRGSVAAGGQVTARFLENATVRAEGLVRVAEYAMRSVIESESTVEISGKNRGLIGGEVRARSDVRLSHAGSPASVPTLVATGESPRLRNLAREAEKEFQAAQNDILQVNKIEGSFKESHPDLAALPRAKAALYARLIRSRVALKTKLKEIGLRRVTLFRDMQKIAPGQIHVTGSVYPGTKIALSGRELEIKARLESVRFILDEDSKKISVLPLDH